MTVSSTPTVRSGSFEDALANGQRLLDRDPAAALQQAETLFRLKRDPRVYRLAAAACRKLGRTADAENAELGAIDASLDEPELQRAAVAGSEGQSAQSLAIARNFLQGQPDDLLALIIAAEASINLWDLEGAERLLRSVVGRAPAFVRASMLLATCLAKQVRMRDAIGVLDEVATRRPDHVPALGHLARLRAEVGDSEQAVALHERLVALGEKQPERWVTLAQQYRIAGRSEDAIRALRRSLELDSSNGSAWWTLANYYSSEVSDEDQATIGKVIEKESGSLQESGAHLAAGLIADRQGDRPKAFDHFVAGKQIRLAHQPYDPDPISAAVDGVVELLTPEFYERRKLAGCDDSSPIFIVGMPRSGTTLVERMLGRHQAIEGVGELQIMPRLAETVRRSTDNPEHYAALLESMSDAQLSWVGARYVHASRDYRHSDKPSFIDKANLNWMQIGLILLALPNARIIDVRRNALDCCWANFKMLFADAYPAANDLRHVGRFYRDYARLLDSMKVAAPGRILSVRYEDVVDDIESQARRMLDFLGFDYDPGVIDFHLATGAVATASSEQVRRPLNREGIGSAEPYRPWLGPLIEELGELANA